MDFSYSSFKRIRLMIQISGKIKNTRKFDCSYEPLIQSTHFTELSFEDVKCTLHIILIFDLII